jgi:hypothetical protein
MLGKDLLFTVHRVLLTPDTRHLKPLIPQS